MRLAGFFAVAVGVLVGASSVVSAGGSYEGDVTPPVVTTGGRRGGSANEGGGLSSYWSIERVVVPVAGRGRPGTARRGCGRQHHVRRAAVRGGPDDPVGALDLRRGRAPSNGEPDEGAAPVSA